MTINASDIKLLESERMTDTPDGGGRRTGNVIPDGVPGNIFSKIARLDSVYGRVNLRKVYAHVDAANTDTYAGAHAAIIDAPNDLKIKVNIFSTGSDFDTRTQARDRIESYVVSGPETRLVLYGRQLAGQQAITGIQRVEEVLPEVGDVFCLSKEAASVVSYQQYVRVEEVTHEVRTFEDESGTFDRRIITLKLSAPLRYEFMGWESAERFSSTERGSLVRATTVADAAQYFGISKLTDDALEEGLEVKVDSIFSNIVPTMLREAAVNLAQIGGASAVAPASEDSLPFRTVSGDLPGGVSSGVLHDVTVNLGGAAKRGSVQILVKENGGGVSGNVSTDDGEGNMIASAPVVGFGYQIVSGTVDYDSGVVHVLVDFRNGVYNGVLDAARIPAADVGSPAHTREIPMTLSTRGTVHVLTLTPLPAPGTVYLEYRAQNKWYRLRDTGAGGITGDDPAYGTGTIDYVTGTLVVTLGALPDVGSSLITGWGSPAHYTILAGDTSDASTKATQTFQLDHAKVPVAYASLGISYVSSGVTYNATVNSSGVISGGGLTGTVGLYTGAVVIEYAARLPDPGSVVTIGYHQPSPADPDAPLSFYQGGLLLSGPGITYTVPTPIKLETVQVTLPARVPAYAGSTELPYTLTAMDDGDGNLVTQPADSFYNSGGGQVWTHEGGDTVGTVDYVTGVIDLFDGDVITLKRAFYQNFVDGTWDPAATYMVPIYSGGMFSFSTGLDNAEDSFTVEGPEFEVDDFPPQIDLTKTSHGTVVPGSVYFDAYGKLYFDRNGVIAHTMTLSGSGTPAGTIDYNTGVVELTGYNVGTSSASILVRACLVKYGEFTAVDAVFRTAGSPLRAASTYIQVTAADGDLLTATTDANGLLTGAFARGNVNQQMGLASIEWGEMVSAAGNEGQPWYDPDNVIGSEVWKPREVMPATIRYNTVVLSNLPVNADILGLDPVRLPSDGRVPIIRPGNVVLIHNTKPFELPNPAVASATYDVGRENLADITLVDAAGTKVPTTEYTADLSAGTVTMDAGMDLTGLTQPLVARHRIEELNLATDAQINGLISLAAPLTRDFDNDDTWVSSCLLFGDLFAHVTNVFDQVTWTGVWSDSRIGDNATAEYNTITYPIEVDNAGAVTERFRINFTSTTAFQVIGENLGVIATGTTAADCSPTNPLTGDPYFTLRSGGWGAGWSVGVQLRFNTVGATGSIWMVRTVLPGATLAGDSVDLQVRGDVDA